MLPLNKLKQTHAINPSATEVSFCGMDNVRHKLKLTANWQKVTCGSCIAQRATANPPEGDAPTERGDIFMDSAPIAGRCSAWERLGDQVYILSYDGERLSDGDCDWSKVEAMFGPMRPISLAEIALRYARELELRLADGNM